MKDLQFLDENPIFALRVVMKADSTVARDERGVILARCGFTLSPRERQDWVQVQYLTVTLFRLITPVKFTQKLQFVFIFIGCVASTQGRRSHVASVFGEYNF